MAGLVLAAGLAAPSAHAGSYTAVGSGGTSPSTVIPAATSTTSSSPQGATAYSAVTPMSPNGIPSYTINISPGTLTTTFTWVPASGQTMTTDPPPTCVLVEQSGSTLWYVRSEYGTGTGSGTGDCGLPGTTPTPGTYNAPLPSQSLRAILCSQKSGASFSVSSSPTASFTGTTGMEGNVEGRAEVSGGASAYPITISLGGTQLVNGVQDGLTGQQITATLQGIPTNYAVTKYTWSGQSATCFKTYNSLATSNPLVPLGSVDLSGPAVGSKTVAPLAFYDSAKENLTITCTVTVLAPDGKSTVNLTATAPPINVLKPTATWGITGGIVRVNNALGTIGFLGLPGDLTYTDGQSWHDVVINVPIPFSGGQFCFAQLITPDRKYYRTLPPNSTAPAFCQILNNGA